VSNSVEQKIKEKMTFFLRERERVGENDLGEVKERKGKPLIFLSSLHGRRLSLRMLSFFFGGAMKGKKAATTTGTAMRSFGRNRRNGGKNPPIQHASDEKKPMEII
jgi:hypothetical protein